MKKIIYLIVMIGAILTSCNPIEDINKEISAKENPVVGDDEITLTSEDYDDLDLAFENFNSIDEAKTLLPPFLSDRYPFWGQGSSVKVNFNLFDGNPEEAGDFVNADVYQLVTEDYPTAASNAFFPNENPTDFLENILENQITNPTEGQIVRAEFKQFTEEPVIGLANVVEYNFAGSFEGWSIVEQSGINDVWTSRTGDVQANGFFGTQVANEEWLVSPSIDLTSESNLKFQINQEIDFLSIPDQIDIMVSTDYAGDIQTATWTPVAFDKTAFGNLTLSEDYDFSAYDGQTINIALKYVSTDTAAGRWRVASLALKTIGISGNTVTESIYYIYNGGAWDIVEDSRYLSAADYDSMGEANGQPGRFNNFSSSILPENYLPQFLNLKFPFAQLGDEMFIIYRFFIGGTFGTVTKGNLYTKTENAWVPSISTLQFGFDNGVWVPDNTIKYTFTSADVAFISNAFITIYPGPADNFGFFGSFDRRPASSNLWTDDMLLEAFNALLDNIDPSAAEGQKYALTYVIFNGSTTNETKKVIKTGGVWVYQ